MKNPISKEHLRTGPDQSRTDPAQLSDLAMYEQARQEVAKFSVPLLADAAHPNRKMFVAAFDGTNNSIYTDERENWTNVGMAYEQIHSRKGGSVATKYQEGVGSQTSETAATLDGMLGWTYSPRMEQMYHDFIVQAEKWQRENPNAEISIASIGFSRGAVTAAMFTRMVEERGIQNPEGMRLKFDDNGRVTSMEATKPPLVKPGQVAQVVGLYDPVRTGRMAMENLDLPPSVIGGFQISARDERRDLFQGVQIIPPGLSKDGRFLNITVPGSHCDVGGWYLLDGLSSRNFNLMAGFLNGLTDKPLVKPLTVPTAPEMNVIHRSDDHKDFYSTYSFDDGQRNHIKIKDKDAPSAAIDARYERQRIVLPPERTDPRVPDFLQPKAPDLSIPPRAPSVEQFFNLLTDAAMKGDAPGMRLVTQAYLQTDAAQQWLQQGRDSNQAQLEREQQQQAEQQLLAQQEQTATRARQAMVM